MKYLSFVRSSERFRGVADGKLSTTDGPFAESKEVIGGYQPPACAG